MKNTKIALVLLLFVTATMSAHAQSQIRHVIIIIQENRTPDNLFHGFPGADIVNSGINSLGQDIELKPVGLRSVYDLGHSHADFLAMYDNGKMDGADKVQLYCPKNKKTCGPKNPQFQYVNPSQVAPYFQMGEQYTFADAMFQTNQGPSYPAHQFLLSGTSEPGEGSDLYVETNPINAARMGAGCFARKQAYVLLIDPSGDDSQHAYPCFEHQTLPDLLDAAGITWKFYTSSLRSGWTAPNSIRHLWKGPDWQNVILDPSTILTDISGNNLAGVSWVTPMWQASDHPDYNQGLGPSWVASIVNAIGNSPYWSNTAIFVTWDDWGGWYDHVAPLIFDQYTYGFRVPLLVVSSYAKRGYVSHVRHDFGSILHFTEEVFNLPSLGFADSRTDNLMDCFQFPTPQPFHLIQAPYDARYFLTHRFSPGPIDND
jgi:phospholipase C